MVNKFGKLSYQTDPKSREKVHKNVSQWEAGQQSEKNPPLILHDVLRMIVPSASEFIDSDKMKYDDEMKKDLRTLNIRGDTGIFGKIQEFAKRGIHCIKELIEGLNNNVPPFIAKPNIRPQWKQLSQLAFGKLIIDMASSIWSVDVKIGVANIMAAVNGLIGSVDVVLGPTYAEPVTGVTYLVIGDPSTGKSFPQMQIFVMCVKVKLTIFFLMDK